MLAVLDAAGEKRAVAGKVSDRSCTLPLSSLPHGVPRNLQKRLLRLPVPLTMRRGPLARCAWGTATASPNGGSCGPSGLGSEAPAVARQPRVEHDVRHDRERRGGEAQQGRQREAAVPLSSLHHVWRPTS